MLNFPIKFSETHRAKFITLLKAHLRKLWCPKQHVLATSRSFKDGQSKESKDSTKKPKFRRYSFFSKPLIRKRPRNFESIVKSSCIVIYPSSHFNPCRLFNTHWYCLRCFIFSCSKAYGDFINQCSWYCLFTEQMANSLIINSLLLSL